MPVDSTWLEVQGDGLFTRTFAVATTATGADLVVARRVCVQLQLRAETCAAGTFEAFDAAGRKLPLEFPTQCDSTSMHSLHAGDGAIHDGRSDPFFTTAG